MEVTPHTEAGLSACEVLVLEDELGRDRFHVGRKRRFEDFIPCVACAKTIHLFGDGSIPEVP